MGTRSRLAALSVVAGVGGLLVISVALRTLRMDMIAAWTGAMGAACAVALITIRFRPGNARGSLGWWLFVVWALTASVLSGRVWAALSGDPTNRLGWMTLAALTAIALAASVRKNEVVRLLRQYAWIVVAAEAAYALVHLAATGDTIRGGTLPNSSDLGIAMALLLPWVIPPHPGASKMELRLRFGTAALAMFALGAIQSRAALVVIGLWAVLSIAIGWRAPLRQKIVGVAVLLLIVVGSASILPGYFFNADGELPLGGRIAAWTQALIGTMQRPLTGWGPDAYWPASAAVRTPEMAAAGHSLLLGPNATDPHNFIIWILVSTGVVGLLAWLWYFAGATRTWWIERSNADARAAMASAACALVLGLYAPLDLHVLPLLAVMMGLSLGQPRIRTRRSPLPDTWQRHAVTAALVIVALSSSAYALNAMCRAPFEVFGEERSPGLAASAARMSSLWPFDAHLAYLSAVHAGWAAVVDPTAGWQDVDMRGLTRAVDVDRRDPFYALERARAIYHYRGTPEEVDAAFTEAFDRYPAYPIARAEYAKYLAETGRYDEARAQLDLIADIDDPEDVRVSAVHAAEAILEGVGK